MTRVSDLPGKNY